MNRIALNYTQRQTLHTLRKETETEIRALKKELRGRPHTPMSSGLQSALHVQKWIASALYTLLAGARGREHTKRSEEVLTKLREAARYYNTYQKTRRQPVGVEVAALLLVEAETPVPATAPAA
jgi:hypothetical protein